MTVRERDEKRKRETRSESARKILRKCGGGGMPVECKWIIKNLINRIGSALPPIYDVMIIHAEVVSRERIFIICLFKLFGRLRQRAAHPREIALLSLPFRINRVSRPDYWKLGSCPLYTLLRIYRGQKVSPPFLTDENVFTIPVNICIKARFEA